MTDHETWMARAIGEARLGARNGDAPVASILVQNGAVLSVGRNTKTSEGCGFAHAELNAILATRRLLGRKPEGCVLYSVLEPCAMCLGAIIFAGIRTLVYGAPDPEGGAVTMFMQHPVYRAWMPEVIAGVLRKECEEALKSPGGVAPDR